MWMEKENYQMHGQASQDSFYQATRRIYMVREDLQGNKRPQHPTMYGQICGSICTDAAKSKAKQKCAIEKLKLDNARQLRGIFFIEPNYEVFQHAMKNARRKLEVPMPAAMPCKTPVNCRGENCRSIGKSKTKYTCIVDADESVRIRLEGVPLRYHKDQNCCKRNNFAKPLQFGTQVYSDASSVKKFQMQRRQWRKNWEKLEKIPAWNLTKVRNKTEVIAKARNEGRKVHFASLMDLCHHRHQKPLHPRSPHHQEVEVRWGRRSLRGSPTDSRTRTLWLLASSRMSVFDKSESRCKFGTERSFTHWSVVTKVQLLSWNVYDSQVASHTLSRQNLWRFLGRAKSTSMIHKCYEASCKHSRKQRSIAE